jgi:transposase-like protein
MTTQRLDLPTLITRYNDEGRCRELLEALRWPDGVRCPRCESDHLSPIETRHKWDCMECTYQFSVTAGTVLQDSKLPLWKWFLGAYLVAEAKKGISSNQLKRMLGVSYKTAWFLTHRIRAAMAIAQESPISGTVEVDETWVGGKPRPGSGPGSRWSPAVKTMVLGAVERGGGVRMKVEHRKPNRLTLHSFIAAHVEDDAPEIYTDSWAAYRGIQDEDTDHETVNHRQKEWVRGDVHTNTIEGVWSLLKRSIVGTHHHMSVKHLPAYLDEIAFKYSHRDNEHIFRETLRVLVTADPLTYQDLTAD